LVRQTALVSAASALMILSVAAFCAEPADNTIYHDARYPSRIILPVVSVD
jgi:predicted acyl esterase